MLHRRLVLLACLILLGVAAAPAPGIAMQIEPYFAGHFKYGEWLPLRVTVANDGPSVRAQLRVDTTAAGTQTVFTAPVELPTGARKRLTLYVQPPSFAREIRVRLVELTDRGDEARELDNQTAPLQVERNINYVVGVIAPRNESFGVLGGLTLKPASDQAFKGPPQSPRPVKAVPIPLADVADRPEGMRTLDALVISGIDTTELTPEQRSSLRSWVDQGGHLIIGGGTGAARTVAGLPAELQLPLAGQTTDLTTVAALGKFTGQDVRVPGPFPAAWTTGGRAVVEQDGHALVTQQHSGEGMVSYSALDLAASPFDAWAGATSFWEKLLAPGSSYPSNSPPDVSPRMMRANNTVYALQNLPALELPSINALAALLAVYILLVGPVNYLVLRRLRRLAWGWITILALTLVFSAGAFTFAYNVRGGDVILNQISILTFDGRGRAAMETSFGIFSPERTQYTLDLPSRVLVSPLSYDVNPWMGGGSQAATVAEIVQGDSTQVRGIQVNQWAMRAFSAESPAPEDWRIESSLVVEGDRIKGTLTNRTGELIADATLVQGNRFVRLGDLAAGQTRAIDQTLSNSFGASFPYFLFEEAFRNVGPTGPSREVQLRQQLLSNYYQNPYGPPQTPTKPTLIGWMLNSPLEIKVAGARWASQKTSLVIATLNSEYPAGPIHLSSGTVPVQILSSRGPGGMCGPTNQFYVGGGSVTIEFRFPEELEHFTITRLTLVLQGGDPPAIEIADPSAGWVRLEGMQAGRIEVKDPARYVAGDGTVQFQLTDANPASPKGSCVMYDLDVEGIIAK